MGGTMMTQARFALAKLIDAAVWEIRRITKRFSRRYGPLGWIFMACTVAIVGAWLVERQQRAMAAEMLTQIAQQKPVPVSLLGLSRSDDRSRLQEFDKYLLGSEFIPDVVQDLLGLAESEKVSITRAVYQPQIDMQGGFMRYRIAMPVKGNAKSIYRFMQAALRAQKTLALESVQFKREQIESVDIEARIQWVVLTRLPPSQPQGAVSTMASSGDIR